MNKNEKILIRTDVEYLRPMLLDERGLYKAVPYETLADIPTNDLQVFANDHAIYQFVTIELLDWLRTEIDGMKALEICAGNGVIARNLGIVGIDSRIQENRRFQKVLQEKYGSAADGFALTRPPREIKRYETLDAIRVFRPDIVVGAFVTPRGTRANSAAGIQCNHYGPDMLEMFKKIKKYIHIGNKNTHQPNPIYDKPHREYAFPWLVSRAFDQSLNRIWVWDINN